MLCMSRARIDLLGVRQKEHSRQLSEATKHETDHIPEVLRKLTDQFMKAIEDQGEENGILHTRTESTLTRQNESATIHAEEQHKQIHTSIADENQKANKRLLDTITKVASAQAQTLSTNVQSRIDQPLLSRMNIVGELN